MTKKLSMEKDFKFVSKKMQATEEDSSPQRDHPALQNM
jgi:hypothetical protein